MRYFYHGDDLKPYQDATDLLRRYGQRTPTGFRAERPIVYADRSDGRIDDIAYIDAGSMVSDDPRVGSEIRTAHWDGEPGSYRLELSRFVDDPASGLLHHDAYEGFPQQSAFDVQRFSIDRQTASLQSVRDYSGVRPFLAQETKWSNFVGRVVPTADDLWELSLPFWLGSLGHGPGIAAAVAVGALTGALKSWGQPEMKNSMVASALNGLWRSVVGVLFPGAPYFSTFLNLLKAVKRQPAPPGSQDIPGSLALDLAKARSAALVAPEVQEQRMLAAVERRVGRGLEEGDFPEGTGEEVRRKVREGVKAHHQPNAPVENEVEYAYQDVHLQARVDRGMAAGEFGNAKPEAVLDGVRAAFAKRRVLGESPQKAVDAACSDYVRSLQPATSPEINRSQQFVRINGLDVPVKTASR